LILVWFKRAINDRDAQIDYIAQDNLLAAVSQGDRIEDQVDMLIDHPKMGRPGRKKDTRELVISRTPFIMVYRIKGQRIELLRLLHGSQQWP
jgi:toxin ParE1/3/4